MSETILTVASILVIFLGIPLLVVRLKDSAGITGVIIKRVVGAISLLFGVTIIGWVLYNIFFPTKVFRANYWTVFQIAPPIAMTWMGWKWLTDTGPGIEEQDIDFDAPEFVAARRRAQETLPAFIAEVGRNIQNAFIMFAFRTNQDVSEHIWASVLGYTNGVFNVSSLYDPEDTHDTRQDVPESEVEDWKIALPDGRIRGAYSYIGAFQYLENRGIKLNKTMLKQKRKLIDASTPTTVTA